MNSLVQLALEQDSFDYCISILLVLKVKKEQGVVVWLVGSGSGWVLPGSGSDLREKAGSDHGNNPVHLIQFTYYLIFFDIKVNVIDI